MHVAGFLEAKKSNDLEQKSVSFCSYAIEFFPKEGLERDGESLHE